MACVSVERKHRDLLLEQELQLALDEGRSVWVVGDVHGHCETLVALFEVLDLEEGDHVLCIGDLIDRGPDSRGVLELVRDTANVNSIVGNHEKLMHSALSEGGTALKTWEYFGGGQTLTSMSTDRQEALVQASKFDEWTMTLPEEVVLKGFRIVHAGYEPGVPPDEQTKDQRLRSRAIFGATIPIDDERQVIVGHTPVQLDRGPGDGESPWFSEVKLADGRPSAVGIDTGIYLDRPNNPRLTAYNLKNGEVVSLNRQEPAPLP